MYVASSKVGNAKFASARMSHVGLIPYYLVVEIFQSKSPGRFRK